MRFGSRGPIEFPECSSRIRHRNALTEKAWEDAVHGQGNLISYPDKQSEIWVARLGNYDIQIPFGVTLGQNQSLKPHVY